MAVIMAALAASVAGAQDNAAAESNPPRRAALGFRVRVLPIGPLSVMSDHRSMTTTASGTTPYDWSFNTSSKSPMLSIGPSFEFQLNNKTTITAEVLFDRLRYQKVTDVYSGRDDPTTPNDERLRTTITEQTKARLWDVPLIVHRGGFRESGVLSHLFVLGGVSGRIASAIRTQNDISYSDGTKANNTNPAQASKTTLLGAVAGIGFRFIDDFNIKVTPEIRYTRWMGGTFANTSTQSPRNQLEIGVAFTH
jgi:hypothetical protein